MIRSNCSRRLFAAAGQSVALRLRLCAGAAKNAGAEVVAARRAGVVLSSSSSSFALPAPPCPASSARRLLSNSSSAAVPERLPIPPNLKFDPRSSFAPQPSGKKKKKQIPLPAAAAAAQQAEAQKDEEEHDSLEEEEEEEYEEEDEEDEFLFLPEKEIQYAIPLPDRLKVEVHTLFAPQHSSLTGTLYLEESVFGKDPIRVDLIKRTVDYHRAHQRGRRKAKTKTISEVSGSGRKVRPQKGTGRARAGHRRPPHWRGGAKAHGPKNTRDYGKMKLNKKVRRLALRHVLSQKLKEGNLMVFNHMHELPTHKTGELNRLIMPWGFGCEDGATALLLDHYYPDEQYEDDDTGKPAATSYHGVPVNLHVASNNLYRLKVGNSHAANVYDILKFEKLVVTVAALEQLEERLKE